MNKDSDPQSELQEAIRVLLEEDCDSLPELLRKIGLDPSDFSNITLHGQLFSEEAFNGARFDNSLLVDCRFQETSFKQSNFSGLEIRESVFRKVRFTNIDFNGCRIDNCGFLDVKFKDADVAAAEVHRSIFYGVRGLSDGQKSKLQKQGCQFLSHSVVYQEVEFLAGPANKFARLEEELRKRFDKKHGKGSYDGLWPVHKKKAVQDIMRKFSSGHRSIRPNKSDLFRLIEVELESIRIIQAEKQKMQARHASLARTKGKHLK